MLFGKKKEGGAVSIINAMTASMERLHVVGGLGYALVGISVIVGAVALVVQTLVPELFNFLMVTIVVGTAIASIERFVAVRLAAEKLRMISGMAQEMVRASIPKTGQMDSAQAARLMQEVLVELWKLNPEPPTAPDKKERPLT